MRALLLVLLIVAACSERKKPERPRVETACRHRADLANLDDIARMGARGGEMAAMQADDRTAGAWHDRVLTCIDDLLAHASAEQVECIAAATTTAAAAACVDGH